MQTNNNKIQISASEISQTLGWPYTTVISIINRQSPADKLKKIKDCEEKLRDAKDKINQELTNTN